MTTTESNFTRNSEFFAKMANHLQEMFTEAVLSDGTVTVTDERRLAITAAIHTLQGESEGWAKIAASMEAN